MTTTTQTEAQRLADALARHDDERLYRETDELMLEAAVELRHLDSLVAGLDAAYKEAMDSLKLTIAERDKWKDAEHALSGSYVRIREVIGAMRPPSLETEELWAYVETVAKDLASERDQLRAKCNSYQILVSALEWQKSFLQRELQTRHEAVTTLQSERDANAILTAENDQLREQLALAVAKEREECGWQPIETAPKDGSDCWLLVDGEVHRGLWVEIEYEEHRDIDGRYIDHTDADAYWMDHESGDSLEPTMFCQIARPLPPPPSAIRARGEAV